MENENKQKQRKPFFRKWFFRLFWTVMFGGILGVFLLFLLTSWGVFGKLPSFEDLENPNLAVATEVYASDGPLLGKIYRKNRVNVTYDELPKDLVNALIATEDERFRRHAGIDLKATIRAILFLGKRGGGSTLTQQLAKNLLGQGTKKGSGVMKYLYRIPEKAKEYFVALKLEKSYTKEEIITMYLNQFEFVNNAIGIQSAAKIYYNKKLPELTMDECAMFAGMMKNPSLFNPKQNPIDSKKRRNVVFQQMKKNDLITAQQQDSLSALPVKINFNKDDHNTGLAPYLRAVIQNEFLPKWVNDNPKLDGGKYDIYRDGLKVYTTIDSRMQNIAEQAVTEHLNDLQKQFNKEKKYKKPWKERPEVIALELAISNSERFKNIKRKNPGYNRKKAIQEMKKEVNMSIYHPLKGEVDTLMSPLDSIKYHRLMLQSAFIVTEPKSGDIKAWVGGRNFKYFKFDRATTKRQIGSTFKPFLYSVAIDNGWSPCYTIPNLPVTVKTATGDIWNPKNSDKYVYDGLPVTLKRGLAGSMNNISAQLIKDIGPRPVITLAERAGMKDVPEIYSIALGATEQTVLDMSRAYTTFANKGISTEPLFISRIEDKNGNVLAEFVPSKVEAMSPQTAYIMLQMMRGVVTSGTAVRLMSRYGLTNFIAGKTGTTNGNTDGWFVGLTPELIGVVWTGADDPAIHFESTAYGQGANAALPIWAKFFKEVYKQKDKIGIDPNREFESPGLLPVSMNCDQVLTPPATLPDGTPNPQLNEMNNPGANSSIPDSQMNSNPSTSPVDDEGFE